MKYLELYHRWMKTGRIEHYLGHKPNGLCNTEISSCDLFQLFVPEESTVDGNAYWASGISGDEYANNRERCTAEFTPLRQNIVLFMAAMNNEL
jgi:hypothetical protein